MWGPGPWGVWSGWWIFPMTGMLVCMGVMALMMWAMRGRGLTCMRGHGHGGHDPEADLQREEQLRASR